MAWNPPDYVDIEEVEKAAREMGYVSDKPADEYFQDLRDSGVTVFGVPERVSDYFNPQAENWTEPMFPAMDMPGGPLRTPIDPADEWTRHIAVLVSNLTHVLPDFEDPYESDSALDFRDLVRLEVYNQILGFKNAPALRRHLFRSKAQEDMPVHKLLGFEEIPHQNTIRKAQNERFTPGASEFVKRWARRIETIGVMRDYTFPTVSEKRLSNNGGVTSMPIERKRGYAQGALDLLRDDMPIEKDTDVSTWTDYGKHFDYSLHLCASNGTPEGELENFADRRGLQKGRDIWDSAETFRNDIYRVSVDDWNHKTNTWTPRLVDAVVGDQLEDAYVPIAIDTTNIPTWSDERAELDGVVGTQKLKNTHYAYRILTAQIVSNGIPIQLAHELQMRGEEPEKKLQNLLKRVKTMGINVGIVLADSEFASGKIVNALKEIDVDFLISYPTHHVRNHLDGWEFDEKRVGVKKDYVINSQKKPPDRAKVNLLGTYQEKQFTTPDSTSANIREFMTPEPEFIKGRQDQNTLNAFLDDDQDKMSVFDMENGMRWFTFITNVDVSEDEALSLRQYYQWRWAIESAYGSFKTEFMPRTKSTNLGMRTYLYMFALCAYNAWCAANIKARQQSLDDSERNRPPIRASRFLELGQQRYRTDEFEVDYTEF